MMQRLGIIIILVQVGTRYQVLVPGTVPVRVPRATCIHSGTEYTRTYLVLNTVLTLYMPYHRVDLTLRLVYGGTDTSIILYVHMIVHNYCRTIIPGLIKASRPPLHHMPQVTRVGAHAAL